MLFFLEEEGGGGGGKKNIWGKISWSTCTSSSSI